MREIEGGFVFRDVDSGGGVVDYEDLLEGGNGGGFQWGAGFEIWGDGF